MKFHHFDLENCETATGVVVVIDVLRAFSTTAYAFSAGVEEIFLVSTVEDAFRKRKKIKNSRIMGEVDGLHVDGFDYGNSPAQFDGVNLSGISIIQRTTSGTQGVVRSRSADTLITTGFCTAGATAGFIESLSPMEVSFVITGKRAGGWGDEDQLAPIILSPCCLKNMLIPIHFLKKSSIPYQAGIFWIKTCWNIH